MTRILHLDTSIQGAASATRAGSAALVERLRAEHPGARVVTRDVAQGIPAIDATWVAASYAEPETLTPDQAETLALSDALVAELQAADIIVIGLPVYNFGLPAGLKNWIDHVARRRVTFRYTENGPEGLIGDKRVHAVFASAGTPIGAPHDFVTPYLRFVLGFLGISDVTVHSAAEIAAEAQPLAA